MAGIFSTGPARILVDGSPALCNLWKEEEPVPVHKFASPDDKVAANPVETLGTRDDYTDVKFLEFSKKMISEGATILGGCCETKPSHIKKISTLKN